MRLPNSATRALLQHPLKLLTEHSLPVYGEFYNLPRIPYSYKLRPMNSSLKQGKKKLSQIKALEQTFERSWKSCPWIFKKITFTFGIVWFPFVAFVFYFFYKSIPEVSDLQSKTLQIGLNYLEHAFTVFIVPFFVASQYKVTKNFKDFLTENVTPFVITYIKATFIVLAYSLLFLVPGIIKAIRFVLLPQTCFFGDSHKKDSTTLLKACSAVSQGYLFSLFSVFFFGLPFLGILLSFGLKGLLFFLFDSAHLELIANLAICVFSFYWGTFIYIAITHFFFIIKAKSS